MGAGCCKEEVIDFNAEIELSHFHLLRSVGKGAFGKVRVVQHKRTKEIYALKYINKAKCIRMRAVENIIQERRLLEEVEFSLICNLRYAFQDDENLFMVLDLMLGGDLRFHLERAGPMREDVVRFYVAELALALDALHARRIIHRDLKPDNVLLDEHGHAHLTDFNIAVYFNPNKPLMSIAGSMAYMAPEVLLRKGYFESVDWWSLGVVMFELLFGKRPFRGKSNDLLTSSILRDPLPFPENVHEMVSAPCVDVVSKLCERDISKRLGCTPEGLDAFKKHPWFEGIEWDKLATKEALPPFEPDSKRANFDATHELEELLMEDNPLKAKKRAQTTPETELSTEMQMMEDKFIVYDFTKVKRSHSLSRGRIIRPVTNDSRMNSGTLDGVVTQTGGSRTDNVPMTTPVRTYRPDSPSDRIGQDRFNTDEDQTPLTEHTYRSSPLNSPALENNYRGSGQNMVRQKSDSEKAGYFEHQQRQQQHLHQSSPFHTQRLDLQSEAIILPPTSLPRPLQPRDNVTGLRVGYPSYSPSTHPSSPTNSLGNSTVATATPLTAYSSSPPPPSTPLSGQHNKPGKALFATPDSGTSLSSLVIDTSNNNNNGYRSNYNMSVPLMESPNIPVRRAVRGREASGQSINSMPAAISSMSTSPTTANNPRLSSLHPTPSSSSNPRRPLEMSPSGIQYPARPSSAYTTTPGDERFMYQQQQQQQYTTGLSPRPQKQQQPNQQQLLQQQQQQLHQQQLYQYEQAFN
ncbi:kinase-like protein [Linnemannia elongata AG-77]|uniref:Kinase-like protein n=1 Tax=Linnemannia elongata AG-77 TaxID=1314771 RepID=A0A197KGW6_9FUNG|nr:kinase-like protein [Linnemannia elongata AG-77]